MRGKSWNRLEIVGFFKKVVKFILSGKPLKALSWWKISAAKVKLCACVCAYMHAFSSCMCIFARKGKLLIVWRHEWNYSLLHQLFNIAFNSWSCELQWRWFSCYLLETLSLFFFFLSFSLFHLFTSVPNPIIFLFQINYILNHPFTLFWCCQKVLYTGRNGQCGCMCVSERLKLCVYVISSLAALRNNCPERSLCLVMACCYLTPRCAEKKWLSNVMAFLDCSSLIQQQWMEPHLLHLTFQPSYIFIKSGILWRFWFIWCPQQ